MSSFRWRAQAVALISAFVVLSAVVGCYWQPENETATLALSVSVAELQPSTTASTTFAATSLGSTSTLAAGEVTANVIGALAPVGDGFLTAYILAESFLSLSPSQLNNYFSELYQAQALSQSEIESRYPTSRMLTRPVDFTVGATGSLGTAGLAGGVNYVVAVMADACDGTVQDLGNGEFECSGVRYEALDFRRVSLSSGQAAQVSLQLDAKGAQFEQFLYDRYGFYDPGTPAREERGFFEIYQSPTAVSGTYGPGGVVPGFTHVAWEYVGGPLGTPEYHIWAYDGAAWEYAQYQPYNLSKRAAGRLRSLGGTGSYVHMRVSRLGSELGPSGNYDVVLSGALFAPTEVVGDMPIDVGGTNIVTVTAANPGDPLMGLSIQIGVIDPSSTTTPFSLDFTNLN